MSTSPIAENSPPRPTKTPNYDDRQTDTIGPARYGIPTLTVVPAVMAESHQSDAHWKLKPMRMRSHLADNSTLAIGGIQGEDFGQERRQLSIFIATM